MSRLTKSQRIKRYRSLYAKAKRKGLVKGDKDARSFNPSSYMRTKLNKMEPYLSSDYTSLKLAPRMAKAYREAPSDITPLVSNGRVLVRNEPRYKALVKNGVPARIRKLKSGQHEYVPLPIKPTSPEDLADVIRANPVFNQLKHEDELFAFKINGHPSYGMFPDLESLVQSLLRYETLDPTSNDEAEKIFRTIEIYRSAKDNWKWDDYRIQQRAIKNRERNTRSRERRMSRMSEEERARYRADINERRKRSESYKRQVERQREKRKSMTPEQLEAERQKARERMRKRRAALRED
jgi:hypothetical protein